MILFNSCISISSDIVPLSINVFTRNLMDISAVPVIKKLSHLPIIVDPSHGTGQRYLIEPMAKAGLVVGADGVWCIADDSP